MKRIILLSIAFFVPAAAAAFKCVDKDGKTHVGDRPPAACADVVVYETSRSGMVIRKIDPTPSPEEIRRRQEEAARKKEADKVAAEQRRKDMALLNTFSSEQEFEVVRDRTIEPIQGRIRSATERIRAIEKREKEVADEMEFYKAGKRKAAGKAGSEPPATLTAELERLEKEKASLGKSVASSEKEIEQTRARFEVDRKRWITLKAESGRIQPASAAAGSGSATKK